MSTYLLQEQTDTEVQHRAHTWSGLHYSGRFKAPHLQLPHSRGTYQAGCCSTSLPSKERMRAPGFSWPREPENKASQLGNSSSSCKGKRGWFAHLWSPPARGPVARHLSRPGTFPSLDPRSVESPPWP